MHRVVLWGMEQAFNIDGISISFGDHICSIYQNKEQQFAPLIPTVKDALQKHYKVVYVVDDNSKEELLDVFTQAGLMLDTYLVSGQLVILTKNETYQRQRPFNADAMLALVADVEKGSRVEGYVGTLGIGEMTAMMDTAPLDIQELSKYESSLNELLSGRNIFCVCQYNEKKFSETVLDNIIRTHPQVIVYGKLHVNKYFYTIPQYAQDMKQQMPIGSYKTMLEIITEE